MAAGEGRAVMVGAVQAALARLVELADMEGPVVRVVLVGTTGVAGPEATQAMGGARVVQVVIMGGAIMDAAREETAIPVAKEKMEEAWVILKGDLVG